MSIIAIIPARMGSTRFPGKPLKPILGLSMIEHVRRRASLCKLLDEVIVATCDKIIFDEVENYGGKVIMTSETHESCVDRVEEAASKIKGDIIINIQGDMPLVDPGSIKKLIKPLLEDENIHYTDMIAPIIDKKEISDPNVVKVVTSLSGNALYYSREAIPSLLKQQDSNNIFYKQLGINAFRTKSLKYFSKLKRTPLEIIESVDMLRLLENNLTIKLVNTPGHNLGVDTPSDLKQVEILMGKDPFFYQYK